MASDETRTENQEVPYWQGPPHNATSELDYWQRECGRLHGVCRDRWDEIGRLWAAVTGAHESLVRDDDIEAFRILNEALASDSADGKHE